MTTDTLPELPTPKYSETIRGVPCITLTEHEHLMREYALQARAQATPSIPSDGPSTYEQRFTAAVAMICGVTPPATLVCDWINKAERHDDLQQWVGSYAPGWVQNIAVLDAAHQMADQPTEGGDHEPAQQATQAEVTDEQILSLDCVSIDSDEHGTSFWVDRSTVIKFARAILSLRPERGPMAYEQIKAEFQRKQDELSEKGASANCPTDLIDFTVGIRFAEAHHGITAQAKKGAP